MTLPFIAWAVVMVIAAAVFIFVVPLIWRRAFNGESNVDWLRIRRAELAEEDPSLLEDAELRVVEEWGGSDQDDVQINMTPQTGVVLPLVMLLALVLIPSAVYYNIGSMDDVLIEQRLTNVSLGMDEDIGALMTDIERRAELRPDNPDYLSLLGEYYRGGERYREALRAYEKLLEQFPENPEVLALAGQSEYLANNRVLTDTARRRSESALAGNPNERTALGTLGMAAFEAEEYAQAVSYWERLQALEAPGAPGYQMMQGIIDEARSRGGLEAAPTSPEDSSGSAAIVITVPRPEGASLPETATVFVLARASGGASRMPIAVVRRGAGELPFTVQLDDSNSMAGQRLSGVEAVDVEVQISYSGQPGRDNAQWLATRANVVPSADAAITLELQANER